MKRNRCATICRRAALWTLVIAASATSGLNAQGTGKAAPGKDAVSPTVSSALNSWERALLASHGNHLQTPGKERTTFTGKLTRPGEADAAITVTREVPDKILIAGGTASGKAVAFAGTGDASPGSLSESDKDLLEALQLDTSDQFFLGKTQGLAYRLIGSHFRADDGSTRNYEGPWYDVYQVGVPLDARGDKSFRFKTFAFDTSTGLLAAVRYQIARAGTKVEVSLEYSGWKQQSGQAVPSVIRRAENGVETWRISVNAASFTQAVSDGAFKP